VNERGDHIPLVHQVHHLFFQTLLHKMDRGKKKDFKGYIFILKCFQTFPNFTEHKMDKGKKYVKGFVFLF
jgi:hypothetical protein